MLCSPAPGPELDVTQPADVDAHHPAHLDEHDATAGAVFYVWISVLNLLLVSICWSFLLEMFSSEQSCAAY